MLSDQQGIGYLAAAKLSRFRVFRRIPSSGQSLPKVRTGKRMDRYYMLCLISSHER